MITISNIASSAPRRRRLPPPKGIQFLTSGDASPQEAVRLKGHKVAAAVKADDMEGGAEQTTTSVGRIAILA